MHCALGSTDHRIINDRIEKYESYIVFSQSRIAAMKNEESTPLAHPPITPIPHAGEWGWSEGGPGQYKSGQHYCTTVVEMQRKPLPLSPGLPGSRGHGHFAQMWT